MSPRVPNETPPSEDLSASSGIACLIWLLLLLGVAIGLTVMQAISANPIQGFGLTIDRLSTILTVLVAGVGTVTFLFSRRYLDGDPDQPRFLRQLTFTVSSAYVLMMSTNLLVLFAAWSLTSVGLHKLLTYFPDRPEALKPARKKFLISRIGDLALIAAIALIWQEFGTLDLNHFLKSLPAQSSGMTSMIGLLIVIAALTKSAQVPFHSWLPETMESPTPVSALMHAGIINAGGALIIRFAPLIIRLPETLLLLSIIGTVTACLGLLAMWAQVKVKRTLAWSTVSQMGFMMVQCGLAAFPAALLHIIGHGCYKAWSFLNAGSLPENGPSIGQVSTTRRLFLATVGTVLAVPAIALGSTVTGFSPFHSPGELALFAVVALAIGQVWVAFLGVASPKLTTTINQLIFSLIATVCGPILALLLYGGMGLYLEPVLGSLPSPTGPMAWISAIIPAVAFAMVTVLYSALPVLSRSNAGRNLYVHAIHGFYFGAVADRIVEIIWGDKSRVTLEVKGV